MTTELSLSKVPELKELEKSRAEQIKSYFEPMVEMLSLFEEEYNKLMSIPLEEITKDLIQEYKNLRLKVLKIRTKTGEIKDNAKKYIRLEDRAIQGAHNIIVWAVQEKEDNLKERENIFETLEKQRLEKLQNERVALLSPYVENATERDLCSMDDEIWGIYLSSKKQEYEDRIKAEQIAEANRIAAESRRKKHIDRENKVRIYGHFFNWDKSKEETSDEDFEQLIIEAKEKQHKHDLEKKEKEAENIRLQKELEKARLKAKAEEEKRKAELKAQLDKEKQIYDAKLKAEQEEKELIQKELKNVKQQFVRSQLEEKINSKKYTDSENMKSLIEDLNKIKNNYVFTSPSYIIMHKHIIKSIDEITYYVNIKLLNKLTD